MNDIAAKLVKELGNVGWHLFQALNSRIPESESPHPEWSPRPLLKTCERTSPPLGWPRETDSLCPRCAVEARNAVIKGDLKLSELVDGRLGEIKAMILEENGNLIMRKTCDKHGTFEDVLSIDPEFSRLMQARFPGRDFDTVGDELVHRHGSSSIRYGRGGVLNIDLTNRCNMMCQPCFANSNQTGVVYEIGLDEIKQRLNDAVSFKPRRQMSVQLNGGEPTLSPHFLDACRYAKEVGYYNVQAATNGIRFALEPEFAEQAKEAGFDTAYLQFDGVTNEANSHRQISNLFEVKMRAIENMAKAKIKTTLVTTLVKTVNDDQVGPIFKFLIENCHHRLTSVSFQPISFTGRDEEISDEERRRKRYTISHLAHELSRCSDGKIDVYRDWYPLGVMNAFTSLADHLRALNEPKGRKAQFGGLTCSCHPDCGASMLIACNRATKAWAPVTQFFDVGRFLEDVGVIVDTARGWNATLAQIGLSFLRNFDERKAPPGLSLRELLKVSNKKMGNSMSKEGGPRSSPWKFLWVGGMWFEDLWVYDFRRTEMCVIPYATQEGEISFCAYNTGVGWRQIIENKYQTATVRDWFKEHGKHKVYAGNKPIDLS